MTNGDNSTAGLGHAKARVAMYAYLISLLVPIGLFFDALLGICRGLARWPELIVLAISSSWVAAASLPLLLVRNRSKFLSRVSKPLVALYSVYFACTLLQVFGSLILSNPEPQVLLKRGTWTGSNPNSPLFPGLPPKYQYTVNEVGLRGPSIREAAGAYRIITVGASTTECTRLDDTQAWPHLLMEEMNSRQKRVRVWVANAGVAGFTSVHHLGFVRTIPLLSQADMLTFQIGAADLVATLSAEGGSTQAMLEADAVQYHLDSEVQIGSLFRHLYIYRLACNLWRRWRLVTHEDVPRWNEERRHMRQAAPIVPLPNMGTGVREYESRILALANECKRRGIRCVFLTQPSMARPDLPPAEQRLLWFGWVGKIEHPRGFLSLADFARANGVFNQKLLQVCRERGLECYDLASHIPRDTTAFYDDYHFNQGGARMVANFIAQQLLNSQPFNSP